MAHRAIFARRAMLPDGWAPDALVEIAGDTIVRVSAGAVAPSGAERAGTLLPGMPNVHSHAFQRAMAGRAEVRTSDTDDFWSWRRAMYDLALRIDPETLYDAARAVYATMLRAGYTSVAEFQYVHRDPEGRWYGDRAAMSDALIRAARDAGIAICLLPALYTQADVAGAPLGDAQRRFATTAEDVIAIAADLRTRFRDDPAVIVGVCAHSLRAVAPEQLRELLAGSPADVPVHLHVAEQTRDVTDFAARYGTGPIAYLLEHFDVGERWCLVHATHATHDELDAIVRSGASVGLCPTTEANLGDGLFRFDAFFARGHYGIGSDSNVTIAPADELRLLEYGQRLTLRRRVVAAAPGRSCGETLYAGAAAGGARATGFATGAIAPGYRADLVILDDDARDERDDAALDRHIFASLPLRPHRVMSGGRFAP